MAVRRCRCCRVDELDSLGCIFPKSLHFGGVRPAKAQPPGSPLTPPEARRRWDFHVRSPDGTPVQALSPNPHRRSRFRRRWVLPRRPAGSLARASRMPQRTALGLQDGRALERRRIFAIFNKIIYRGHMEFLPVGAQAKRRCFIVGSLAGLVTSHTKDFSTSVVFLAMHHCPGPLPSTLARTVPGSRAE